MSDRDQIADIIERVWYERSKQGLSTSSVGAHCDAFAVALLASSWYADTVKAAEQAGADRVTAAVAALAQRECHQCAGSGQQVEGESGVLRSVTAPLSTETCHLCGGNGEVRPFAVTIEELREAVFGPAPKTQEEKVAFRKEWDKRVSEGQQREKENGTDC